jgi:hypothetical protein
LNAGADVPVPVDELIMHGLSKDARFILDRMEPDRSYGAANLRALVPHASAEGFREVMHELWVNRQVERVGSSGWQRRSSAPAHQADAQPDAGDAAAPRSAFRQTKVVKPEDLFDYGSFGEFFR